MNDLVFTKGFVSALIEYKDGQKIDLCFPNTVLRIGREAIARNLSNNIIGDYTNLYVSKMIFGNGGTSGGQVKIVDTNRTGLFGVQQDSRSVISQINPSNPTQCIFTAVQTYGTTSYTENEMALVLNNGDLYSLTTFGDLTKTPSMQITWTWMVNYI